IVLRHLSNNCLAGDKVLYQGHAVAAVAAVNGHIAEEALARIKVDYELLPPVIDVRQAMEPGAPILHADLVTESMAAPNGEKKPTNIAKHLQYKLGDPDKAFAEAAVVIEKEF